MPNFVLEPSVSLPVMLGVGEEKTHSVSILVEQIRKSVIKFIKSCVAVCIRFKTNFVKRSGHCCTTIFATEKFLDLHVCLIKPQAFVDTLFQSRLY